MRLTVDGRVRELEGDPLTPLLDALREAGVTAPKAGCRQGGCGACTVLVDGEPRRSCLLPLAHAEGARVVTAAGLGDPQRLSPLQRAFHEHYGAQCGFCTGGMLCAATALVERRGAALTRAEVVEALAGHYCRCTGYEKIIASVLAAAREAAA